MRYQEFALPKNGLLSWRHPKREAKKPKVEEVAEASEEPHKLPAFSTIGEKPKKPSAAVVPHRKVKPFQEKNYRSETDETPL